MAIENLAIAHSDLEIRGGLQYVGVGLYSAVSGMAAGGAFSTGADEHFVTLVGGDSLALFDLKQGTGSLTTSGSKEGGTIMFEHTVSFYVPNISTAHLSNLQTMANQDLVVITQGYDASQKHIIGMSKAYQASDSVRGNAQMYARLTSIEGGTGAALGDENGVTVTIVAQSGELPRTVANTLTIDPSAGTLTT
jgi:hypothetical protein